MNKDDTIPLDQVLKFFRSGMDTSRIARNWGLPEAKVAARLREALERDREARERERALQALREKGWAPAFSLEPQEKPRAW